LEINAIGIILGSRQRKLWGNSGFRRSTFPLVTGNVMGISIAAQTLQCASAGWVLRGVRTLNSAETECYWMSWNDRQIVWSTPLLPGRGSCRCHALPRVHHFHGMGSWEELFPSLAPIPSPFNHYAESAHSDVIWSVTQAVQLSEFESTGDIRRTGLLLATGQCRAKNVPSMWGSENRG